MANIIEQQLTRYNHQSLNFTAGGNIKRVPDLLLVRFDHQILVLSTAAVLTQHSHACTCIKWLTYRSFFHICIYELLI